MNQWEVIASNYEVERDKLSLPAILVDDLVLKLADAGPQGNLLDFGSGSGTLTRLLAARGRRVTAYEPNKPMQDVMLKQTSSVLMERVTPVSDLADIAGTFETILCINVVDHLLDVYSTFQMFRKMIAPNGNVIICIPHPLKNLGKWIKERNGDAWDYVYYRLEDYMKEGPVKRDREDVQGNLIIKDVYSQHRTISTYYNWAVNAGFRIERMYEPGPRPEHETEFSAYYKQCSRIPYFWILECKPM